MLKNLYLVILNWNLKDDTIACIESALNAGASIGQLIVVDNGSTDGSPGAFRKHFSPPPHLLELSHNIGFAGGMNQGIQMALDFGAEWLLLLNNDILLDVRFLQELEEAVQTVPENTILAPLILDYFHPDRISYVGDRRILGTLLTRSLYVGQSAEKNLPAELPVDFITGCAMLIPSRLFSEIGMFDSQFFMYAEDVDFCWRAHLAGYSFKCATHARLRHKVSGSMGKNQSSNRYWRISNQISFYRRYSRGLQRMVLFLFTICRSLIISLKDFWHRRPDLLVPLWKGFYDGWRGKMNAKTLVNKGS